MACKEPPGIGRQSKSSCTPHLELLPHATCKGEVAATNNHSFFSPPFFFFLPLFPPAEDTKLRFSSIATYEHGSRNRFQPRAVPPCAVL